MSDIESETRTMKFQIYFLCCLVYTIRWYWTYNWRKNVICLVLDRFFQLEASKHVLEEETGELMATLSAGYNSPDVDRDEYRQILVQLSSNVHESLALKRTIQEVRLRVGLTLYIYL